MGRCCKKYLNKMLDAYIEEIEDISRTLQKNFEEMDFENARTREDMQVVVDNMKSTCKDIRNMIEENKG